MTGSQSFPLSPQDVELLPIFEGALIASVTYTFVSFGQTAELNSAQLF